MTASSMTTVGVDIKALLTTSGYTGLNLGFIPDTTQTSITIFETGGYAAEQVMGSVPAAQDRPSFQIRVRNPTYAGGMAVCHELYTLLDSITNASVNDTFYQMIRAVSPPVYLGIVQSNGEAREFSINFQTMKNR